MHEWKLAGDIEDLRPVGPVAAVVVARASHDQSTVFFCQRQGCTTAATVQSEKPVRLVRRTSATVGPIQARRLQLHPARVRAGGTIDVRGFDQCPAREIVFAMDAAAGGPDAPIVGKTTADRTGAITERVHIPPGTAPGEYLLMTVSVRDESTPEFDCLSRGSSAVLTVEP